MPELGQVISSQVDKSKAVTSELFDTIVAALGATALPIAMTNAKANSILDFFIQLNLK